MAPSPRETSPELKEALEDTVQMVDKAITRLLPETDLAEAQLYDAMRYGTLAGGKRLRPFMVMQSAKLFNVDPARAKRVAAAIELIHAYSLIHDDLPAMDNSDMRRGKLTVHRAYDEATAILAGDALHTMAFRILTETETHEDPYVRCALVAALAEASGPHGMIGGQMLDLIGENAEFDLGTISRMQRMKTGKLMAFSCEAGAILGKASDSYRRALTSYAYDLGLAFQVTDDILDVEADPNESGKPANQDEKAGKATFVSTMGKDQAKQRAEMLVEQAISHLHVFQGRAGMLEQLAYYVLNRRA
ncbi:MAG: polyprenyl synthetase family protein [Alphaproteobacteria bacterium]|jgi:farnesyl diphosphate synthase|nr:polyprenyl synthetase family protein [Alphaproteobacteria bacterium]MCB1551790.1 polyprenyl synthetase family protein [Alphaproteobacteria bacterium]MCB9984995.1 polyprenyl synthetase family protein [Micavibrio sp.]